MQKLNDSLFGRLLTVLFATLAASGLVYLIFFFNRAIVPLVLQWTLVAGLGFTAGFSARAFLPGRTFLLRFLTALLALLSGLVFLGLISRGVLGARLPRPDQAGLNLGWLGQFGLAGLAAWFSLSAWKINPQPRPGRKSPSKKKTSARKPGPPQARPGASKNARPAQPPKSAAAPKRDLPPLAQPEFWQGQWEQFQGKLRRWWEHGLSEPVQAPALRRRKKPAVHLQTHHVRRPAPPKSASAASTSVHLIGKEEHRCPYCLEEVDENDPRGVKVCPICHTYHHADCWAVTGTCQVPHYHE